MELEEEPLELEDDEGFLEKPSFSFTFVEKDFLPLELELELRDRPLEEELLDAQEPDRPLEEELREELREELLDPHEPDRPLLTRLLLPPRNPPRNPPLTRTMAANIVQYNKRPLISLTDKLELEFQLSVFVMRCVSHCLVLNDINIQM